MKDFVQKFKTIYHIDHLSCLFSNNNNNKLNTTILIK